MKDSVQIEAITDAILDYLQINKALDLLPQIAQRLTAESWVKIDPDLAQITAPIKLSLLQIKAIKKQLSTHFKRPIRVKTKIDSSIIAGLRINVAGKIIDATINHRLKALQEQIIYD
ncbi:MAG: F0F1 ATP synthase subunit delta [Patescibacteria group bacterium]|nr:F0F1 ATP synthase subunit delta [Patescibacteria group bacterium]